MSKPYTSYGVPSFKPQHIWHPLNPVSPNYIGKSKAHAQANTNSTGDNRSMSSDEVNVMLVIAGVVLAVVGVVALVGVICECIQEKEVRK